MALVRGVILRGDVGRVEIERARIDVGEDDLRAASGDRVGRRDPAQAAW